MADTQNIAEIPPDTLFTIQCEADKPLAALAGMSVSGTPGIYLQWEQRAPQVAFYQILRAPHINGPFETLVTLYWPASDYIDTTGQPHWFYKIREIGTDNRILSTSEPIPGEELLVKATLAYELHKLLRVHINDEEAIFERNRTGCRWTFGQWNAWPRPEIRISGVDSDGNSFIFLDDVEPIFQTTTGDAQNYPDGLRYKLDYGGKAYFLTQGGEPAKVQPYDSVYASYEVRLISPSQMNQALHRALQAINAQPGVNKYPTVGTAPFWYDAALISGAAYYLIRALLVSLTNREWRVLLQDPEHEAFDALNHLKELAKMYEDEFKEQLKVLPISKYPRTRTISIPDQMLPGGRSRFYRQLWLGNKAF